MKPKWPVGSFLYLPGTPVNAFLDPRLECCLGQQRQHSRTTRVKPEAFHSDSSAPCVECDKRGVAWVELNSQESLTLSHPHLPNVGRWLGKFGEMCKVGKFRQSGVKRSWENWSRRFFLTANSPHLMHDGRNLDKKSSPSSTLKGRVLLIFFILS